jgi:hypothetical protein
VVRLNKKLDPSHTGREADDLRRLVIGQDEVIEQILNIYQTFLQSQGCAVCRISITPLSRTTHPVRLKSSPRVFAGARPPARC